jgi:type II secretory pathway component GspD/PulD (secretin)
VTIIIDPESLDAVPNPITLSLTNMTFKTAIEWVLRLSGLGWTLDQEAIWIATPDKIQGDKIMQIYDVRDLLGDVTYFNAPDMTLNPTEGAEFIMPEQADPEEQLANLIEMIQTKIEPQSWDETTGASLTGREGKLIVNNTEEILRKIEQLLDSFRKAQKLQVYINARFITITSNFLEDIGVSWSGLDRDATTDLPGIAGGQPAGFASDPTKRTGGWDAYDLRGVILNRTTNDILGITNMPYQSGEGLNLSYALLGDFQAEVILNAIQKSRKGVTLLAPRITVFNTQRAYMMVAREESYIADYEGLIATQAAILDPVIKTFVTGMILDVRPIISSDRKYITIELRPTQATLLALREYVINAAAWGTQYRLQAPVIELQKVRTTAVIPDNGILLLGGQISVSHWRMTSGVPFVSKLPIIGRLFSHDAEAVDKAQLLIFINARIIMFEELEEQIRAK